jgi:DNA-directed RNA polymerase specialized sigma subunit
LKKYWRKQAEDWETDSIDDSRDEAKRDKLWRSVEARTDHSSNPELNAINNEALSILEPAERLLFELRYHSEWDVYNRDPSVMTICRYLGIGDRAVRYRLERIEAKLKEWSGGSDD